MSNNQHLRVENIMPKLGSSSKTPKKSLLRRSDSKGRTAKGRVVKATKVGATAKRTPERAAAKRTPARGSASKTLQIAPKPPTSRGSVTPRPDPTRDGSTLVVAPQANLVAYAVQQTPVRFWSPIGRGRVMPNGEISGMLTGIPASFALLLTTTLRPFRPEPSRAPEYDAYTPADGGGSEAARVGAAWKRRDGAFYVQFTTAPLNGLFVLRPRKPKPQAAAADDTDPSVLGTRRYTSRHRR